MSTNKFAIVCIVLVFLASFHECANLEKGSIPTCSKTPKNLWCCSSNKSCRNTQAECQKFCIFIPPLKFSGENFYKYTF
ncbi:hypothetical protein Bca4012_036951 [Brassica carinata]